MPSTLTDRISGVTTSAAWKVPVRLATTANITLSGEQTIDSVSAVDGDRVLVKNQSTTSQNGVYVVSTGSWTRAADFDNARDVKNGTLLFVTSGSTNSLQAFRVTGTDPIVPGTSNVSFTLWQSTSSAHVSPITFGAVGDGTTDDTVALQAAIAYAKTQVNDDATRLGFAGPVWVDLGGLTYLVTDTVTLDQCGGVGICNGKLIADENDWNGDYVLRAGEGTGGDDRYVQVSDIRIECSTVANGLGCHNVRSSEFDNIDVHGMVSGGYGVRVWGSLAGDCLFRGVRAAQYWFGETGYDTLANRTAYGISDEVRDNRFINCEGFYCLYPANIMGGGSHVWIGGHLFNGLAAPTTWDISAVVDNGSGYCRITTTSTSGLSTGDLVVVPWLTGVSGETGGGRPGVYAVTVINGTTLDLGAFAFAGDGYDGTGQTLIKHADEPICMRIQATATNVRITGCQFDNGKIYIKVGASGHISDCNMIKSSTGDGGYSRCCIEVHEDTDTGVTVAAISVKDNWFRGVTPYRFTATGTGTFASVLKCSFFSGHRYDGNVVPAIGRTVVGEGTKAAPALIFCDVNVGEDEAESVQNDGNTGFYHPAADYLGASTGGAAGWMLDDTQRFIVGAEASVAVSNVHRKLQTHSATANGGSAHIQYTNDTVGGGAVLAKTRSTVVGTINSTVQAGDSLGAWVWAGDSGSALVAAARMNCEVESGWADNARKGKVVISTTTQTNLVDRWEVGSNGTLRPATGEAYDIGTASLECKDIFSLNALTVTSDERKKDITGSPMGLAFLQALTPIAYTWKVSRVDVEVVTDQEAVLETRKVEKTREDGTKEFVDEVIEVTPAVTRIVETPVAGVRTHYGLSAQNVKAALDQHGAGNCAVWVMADPNDPDSKQGLRYTELIPVLVQGFKELVARVETLEGGK